MKNYLLITATLVCIAISSTAQTLQWANKIGGTNVSGDHGKAIALDAANNVYTLGTFRGTADFDPGVGVYNLSSSFGSAALFISKLDQHGNFVWAKHFDSGGTNDGTAITIDAQGNIYATGQFSGTIDFDLGVGVANLTALGIKRDVFVLKLDSNGDFVWVRQMGGTEEDLATSINIDVNGNVYTTGNFFATADFDPGAGVSNLVSAGVNDIFISKLDANGNFIYAKRIGGTNSDQGFGITSDMSGNIYCTGAFWGNVDFDPNGATYNLSIGGNFDAYVLKLDSSGNFGWAVGMGSSSSDAGHCILLDDANNLYVTGYFIGGADFNPGAGVFNLVSAGSSDGFISKLDSAGNFIWAKRFGGTDEDYGRFLAKDLDNNIYIIGYFSLTADFNPSGGGFNMTSAGLLDVHITSFDSSSTFRFAKKVGGTGYEYGNGIAIDNDQNIYATGSYVTICDFDPDAGVYNLNSSGGSDGFIMKLGTCSIDPSITQVNNTLTSNALGAMYQWIDCNNSNAPIAGETNQSFTPTVSGDYAVVLSQGLCTDTSVCTNVIISSTNIYGFAENTTIFPNPTSTSLTIKTDEIIEIIHIYNTLGALVQSETQKVFSVEQLPVGVYMLQIKTANGLGTTRFIKE